MASYVTGLTHARVAINDATPVQLTPEGVEGGSSVTIQVQNLGSEAVYLGGAGLTSTSYGVSIVPGGAVTIDNLPPAFEAYALSASGDSYVGVLMVRR
jgi:hypothetical protein